MTRGSYNTHSDYRISGGDRVTNTRYNETDFKTGIGYSNLAFFGSSIQLQQIRFGNSRRWYCSKRLQTPRFQDKGFNHLLSLNSVYLKIQN
jgi:iron complex outermembrane receptor protein